MTATNFQAAAGRQGRAYENAVIGWLTPLGWHITARRWQEPITLVEIDLVATDRLGSEWWIECKGSWENPDRAGLLRNDSVKKLVANAALLSTLPVPDRRPLMVVTSDTPERGAPERALRIAQQAGWLARVEVLQVP